MTFPKYKRAYAHNLSLPCICSNLISRCVLDIILHLCYVYSHGPFIRILIDNKKMLSGGFTADGQVDRQVNKRTDRKIDDGK